MVQLAPPYLELGARRHVPVLHLAVRDDLITVHQQQGQIHTARHVRGRHLTQSMRDNNSTI